MIRPIEDKWEPIDSLGTTGETVARNVKRLRGTTPYTELSAQLAQLGRDIPTWGLRKIESGGRRVDADDLVALAVALEVSPLTLLTPVSDSADSEVSATAAGEMTAGQLFRWFRGDAPHPGQVQTASMHRTLPEWEVAAELASAEVNIDDRIARGYRFSAIAAQLEGIARQLHASQRHAECPARRTSST